MSKDKPKGPDVLPAHYRDELQRAVAGAVFHVLYREATETDRPGCGGWAHELATRVVDATSKGLASGTESAAPGLQAVHDYINEWPMEDASKATLCAMLAREIHQAVGNLSAATRARAAAAEQPQSYEPVH